MLKSVDPEPVVLDPIPDHIGDTRLPQRGLQKSSETNHGDVSGTAVCEPKLNTEPQWKPSDNEQIDEKLNLEDKRRSSTLIDKYSDVFVANTKDMGRTSLVPRLSRASLVRCPYDNSRRERVWDHPAYFLPYLLSKCSLSVTPNVINCHPKRHQVSRNFKIRLALV